MNVCEFCHISYMSDSIVCRPIDDFIYYKKNFTSTHSALDPPIQGLFVYGYSFAHIFARSLFPFFVGSNYFLFCILSDHINSVGYLSIWKNSVQVKTSFLLLLFFPCSLNNIIITLFHSWKNKFNKTSVSKHIHQNLKEFYKITILI